MAAKRAFRRKRKRLYNEILLMLAGGHLYIAIPFSSCVVSGFIHRRFTFIDLSVTRLTSLPSPPVTRLTPLLPLR